MLPIQFGEEEALIKFGGIVCEPIKFGVADSIRCDKLMNLSFIVDSIQ